MEVCTDLRGAAPTGFIVSLLIILGILISYLPQHYRIVTRRSSQGLSPYFVLLGTTSGTCAFANIVTLPASLHALKCCRILNGFDCAAAMLGIAQIGTQWASFLIILFLYILFFPASESNPSGLDTPKQTSLRTAIVIFVTCILHAAISFILSLYFIISHPSSLQIWADFLGVQGAILAAIQFIPQIWTTRKTQQVGSLSIPTMCIQTPGSFIWVLSLAFRLGSKGWSTWGIYLVTGCLQGYLLAICIEFDLRDRIAQEEAAASSEETNSPDAASNIADERRPLLSHQVEDNED